MMSNSNLKISYGKAADLNEVLGKIKTKALNSSKYIALLRFKSDVKSLVKNYAELQKEIYDEFSIEQNYDGSVNINPTEAEKLNNLGKALKELSNGEVEIIGGKFLSMDDFEKLRQTNTDLLFNEEEFLYEWLVASESVTDGDE